MKWEYFSMFYVLWGLMALWLVFFFVWMTCSFKMETERYIECFYKHWSAKALFVCLAFIIAGCIVGKAEVIDALETEGYRLIVEREGFTYPQHIEVQHETYTDFINIFDCSVNHKNKLIFCTIRNSRYDSASTPKTLDEVVFLNSG